jgi:hypothetical protein
VIVVEPRPDWLVAFVNEVTPSIYAHDALSPLGCHFQFHGGTWEITLFASRTEIIGGSEDGRIVSSGFSLDVSSVLKSFSSVQSIEWQAHSLGQFDELGQHISVTGVVGTESVWLRILANAPERFEPGRRALVNELEFEET